MSRKFSDISLNWKIWLIDLINLKRQKFNSRLTWDQKAIGDLFSNSFTFLPLEKLSQLDAVTKKIFDLIRENPDVEMDETIDGLWQDVKQKYSSLYLTIENFNESWPWVNEILNSNEWRNFIEQAQRQIHEFDRQNNNSWRFEKLIDLETRTYTLFSLIKNNIFEANNSNKKIVIPKELEESKETANYLIENRGLLESAIQSAKSIQTFNVNNIDNALKNVSTMLYYGDLYSVFKSKGSFGRKLVQAFFLMLQDISNSPNWWFLGWLFWLSCVVWVLFFDVSILFLSKNSGEMIKLFESNWHIFVSIHIIGSSFMWYLTVFCFNNYKKVESRKEAYKFRSILTKSFWYLLETADEEQKKILYPKALDVIFKDLPESISHWQDLNINLPITEILKSMGR